jgi:hypothetical protein
MLKENFDEKISLIVFNYHNNSNINYYYGINNTTYVDHVYIDNFVNLLLTYKCYFPSSIQISDSLNKIFTST